MIFAFCFLAALVASQRVPKDIEDSFYVTLHEMKEGFDFNHFYEHRAAGVPYKFYDLLSALKEQNNSLTEDWLWALSGDSNFNKITVTGFPPQFYDSSEIGGGWDEELAQLESKGKFKVYKPSDWLSGRKRKIQEYVDKRVQEIESLNSTGISNVKTSLFLSYACLTYSNSYADLALEFGKMAYKIVDQGFANSAPVLASCLTQISSEKATELLYSLVRNPFLGYIDRFGVFTSFAKKVLLSSTLSRVFISNSEIVGTEGTRINFYKPLVELCADSNGRDVDPEPLILGTGMTNFIKNCAMNLRDDINKKKALIFLIGTLHDGYKRIFSNLLLHNPELAKNVADAASLSALSLVEGGDYQSSFSSFLMNFVSLSENVVPSTIKYNNLMNRASICKNLRTYDINSLESNWTVRGSTIYRPNKGDAVKLPTGDESDSCPLNDARFQQCLLNIKEETRVNGAFKSALPLPLEIMMACIGPKAKRQIEKAGTKLKSDETYHYALRHTVPKYYNLPLHRAKTFDQLLTGSINAMNDVGLLAGKYGLVYQSNPDLTVESDQHRNEPYYWDATLLPLISGKNGAQSLHNLKKSLQNINVSPEGLRNYQNIVPLTSEKLKVKLNHDAFWNYIAYASRTSPFMDKAPKGLTELINQVGGFIFSWVLSVALWFAKYNPQNINEWQKILVSGFTSFLVAYTNQPYNACEALLNHIVDWKILVDQLKYFVAGEYINDFKSGKMKENLYGSTVKIFFDPEDTFVSEGWRSLNPKDGPFPATELIRSIYLTLSFAINLRSK